MKLTDTQRIVLTVCFIVAFLITGKVFILNKQAKANLQTGDPLTSVAELQSGDAAQTTAETTVTTTELTTTVTTTAPDHFELVPPDAVYENGSQKSGAEQGGAAVTTETVSAVTEPAPAETEAPAAQDPSMVPGMGQAPADYFNDALFIGDSRTVGQACFGPIDGATYFATVGLGTYKIDGAISEVPGTEGLDFASVLGMKQYGKVYIMLGINELGNDVDYTIGNFRNLITRIQTAQPNAIIYLEANLHVSLSRHSTDAVVNNTIINTLNAQIGTLADNQNIYYIDVNPIFDDAYGCLTAEYTSDGTHPYAKHYAEWAEFIRQHAVIR
ncbi:MAG: lipase [Oscillospiraceae bacterium]|nr:lipase [Oscillospiraceae bacterium]